MKFILNFALNTMLSLQIFERLCHAWNLLAIDIHTKFALKVCT